jgi:hypothetical protein
MTGDRVAVLDRGPPVPIERGQVVGPERHPPFAQLHRERARGTIDHHDPRAVTVGHPERAIVAPQHDAITDREARQLVTCQPARRAHQRMPMPVELGDVDSAVGDHHRTVSASSPTAIRPCPS